MEEDRTKMGPPESGPDDGPPLPDRVTNPHAYHRNLPAHCIGDDGIPFVTKHAERKARRVVDLARSIVLTEETFLDWSDGDEREDGTPGEGGDGGAGEAGPGRSALTMPQIIKMCNRFNTQLAGLENLKYSGITQIELCEMLLRVLRLLSATVTITESDAHHGAKGNGPTVDVDEGHGRRRARLHSDDIGTLLGDDAGMQWESDWAEGEDADTNGGGGLDAASELERRLTEPFALPSPAREALLSVAIHILSKKGPLMSVSNAALVVPSDDGDGAGGVAGPRRTLVIKWEALLRMLLRTAPYLDEHKAGVPPKDSSSRQNTVLKRTVELIRSSRRFFVQGITPTSCTLTDETARRVWNMVKDDLLYHTHSNSYFRSVILLYLFSPSRCTSEFYEEVMPVWLSCWNSVDRCPELDYLWLVMFCRARKYVKPEAYDWGQLRRRLITQCGYWLQIPVGGSSSDNSFPRAAHPRSRGLPFRLKSFVGNASSYQEGIDFVRKVSKLLVFCIGKDDLLAGDSAESNDGVGNERSKNGASSDVAAVSNGTDDLLRFLSFVAPYFHPSNNGAWTYPLGVLLHYLSYDFCRRVGLAASIKSLGTSHAKLAVEVCRAEPYQNFMAVPENEIVAILDAFLPLCQQALYSKSSHVGSAGESALLYLTQVDPTRVSPPFLDFAARALDVSSVTMSHQAPAALSALTRLVQPSLRRRPSILLSRLPDLLRLSLAGIDSNDQNKTIRTLILYRNLTSWLPIGTASVHAISDPIEKDGTIRMGRDLVETLSSFCKTTKYEGALSKLPESSLLVQENFGDTSAATEDSKEQLEMLLEETALATSDWALAFLDRIYLLLHAAGEQEKVGKSSHGVASRHSSADVRQARNFSRVLKECLIQAFASMDDCTHESAVRSVAQFLTDETLPFAAKDASALCQAVGCARYVSGDSSMASNSSPGLDVLVPILIDDLSHHSRNTIIYRLRCLSGAVKYAGKAVLSHRDAIMSMLEFAFSHKDKHVFKTGCKLLRHTLASQCEAYPIASGSKPRLGTVGKSAQLRGDSVQWHVPDGEQIDFAVELVEKFALGRIRDLGGGDSLAESFVEVQHSESTGEKDSERSGTKGLDFFHWRRALRVLRYSLRGCSGILLDAEVYAPDQPVEQRARRYNRSVSSSLDENEDAFEAGPHEMAARSLVFLSSKRSQAILVGLRGNLCEVVSSILSLIASETSDEEVLVEESSSTQDNKTNAAIQPSTSISSDAKVCKEIITIALLLLTRRSAPFRCTDMKTVWTAQKEIIMDYALADQAEYIASALQRAGSLCTDGSVLYKDGEDGGKTLPRRLLVTRVHIFHQAIQREASYEVPRRLRKLRGLNHNSTSGKLFTLNITLKDILMKLQTFNEGMVKNAQSTTALDGYEGLIDGLFAASCLSNVEVRGVALGTVDYALTRFGWAIRERVPRLLSALSLQDEKDKGKYGIPSCMQLSRQVDAKGKHKRLAEVMKGVCSIIALPRAMKEMLATQANRLALARNLCATQSVISLLPTEEMQKMVHYFQGIFSSFRSRFFLLPRISAEDQSLHESLLLFLLDILSSENGTIGDDRKDAESMDQEDKGATDLSSQETEMKKSEKSMNWRNRLTTGWILTSCVDERDMLLDDPRIASRLWSTCFDLIASETGQPLQRVALGLLGRLVTLSLVEKDFLHLSSKDDRCEGEGNDSGMTKRRQPDVTALRQILREDKFCQALGDALVYDHKADTSVGGGHHAQWSAGVEDIIRDASANVAPKTLFPFQRTSRSSHTFKVGHAQLVQAIMLAVGREDALIASAHVLKFAREMAAALPSEDQRNQMCTSAEIFSGVCRSLLQCSKNAEDLSHAWNSVLIPFLSDVIPKIPIAHSGAFFDAFRYGIHHFPPSHFYDLFGWLIGNVEATLWQYDQKGSANVDERATADSNTAPQSPEGFTTQSKWLFLVSAVLIELDDETDLGALSKLPWYTGSLLNLPSSGRAELDTMSMQIPADDLRKSWKVVNNRLLPRLLLALGHPYDKCRDHISGCLFRICYCHRKFLNTMRSKDKQSMDEDKDIARDPGDVIIEKLARIGDSDEFSFKVQHHALITARKFIVYCVHLGDCKNEFSEFVIPLLPLCFEALKVTLTDESGEVDAANRMLEAEVVKGYRHQVAEVSCSCQVVYGRGGDITRVIDALDQVSKHEMWQIRQAGANFLRCFQGGHKFVFSNAHTDRTTEIVARLLADERREVSSAAMAALTGILAAMPLASVTALVKKYITIANKSVIKRKKRKVANASAAAAPKTALASSSAEKEKVRAQKQQTSVFFLCASILARPYDTPPYVPEALASISKHSFERSAPLTVRDTVKMCCSEFKKTHMSDNWEVHKKQFTQEQLEALEDVVSTPHYYA